MIELNYGKKLAEGEGLGEMLDLCYKKGWSDDNTIIEHDGYNWEIYKRV